MRTCWHGSLGRLRIALCNASLALRGPCVQPVAACRQTVGAMGKFYAVKVGRQPGIFRSWDDCREQVHGFSGAEYKSFVSLAEAESFTRTGLRQSSSSLTQPKEKAISKLKPDKKTGKPDKKTGKKRKLSPPVPAALPHAEAAVELDPTETYRMEFDGASRGNPGQAGAGAVLLKDDTGEEVGQVCVSLGHASNNVAEYTALIKGLEAAKDLGVQSLEVAGDSLLVVNQLNREWKVKHEGLKPLHKRADELKSQFRRFSIRHVFREFNVAADALSNEAIDTGGWEGLRLAGTANHKRKKLAADPA